MFLHLKLEKKIENDLAAILITDLLICLLSNVFIDK